MVTDGGVRTVHAVLWGWGFVFLDKEVPELLSCLGIIVCLYLVLLAVIRIKQAGEEIERELGKREEI